MNIVAACELLGGGIQISSVRYGAHAVQRINAELPVEYHLGDTFTGSLIIQRLHQLPANLQTRVFTMAVLTPSEVSAFVDDIAKLRQLVKTQHGEKDEVVEGYLMLYLFFGFVVAGCSVMRYVFTSTANGDTVTGTMVTALKYILDHVMK